MSLITFSDIKLRPTTREKRGRDVFTLADDVEVRLNGEYLTTIPTGFDSDGASLPWFARFKWSSWGKYSAAALLHDYLLTETDRDKWEVDVLFYIALRSAGVSALEATVFWLSVRMKRIRD